MLETYLICIKRPRTTWKKARVQHASDLELQDVVGLQRRAPCEAPAPGDHVQRGDMLGQL